MPNRIIKDSICESRGLSEVSFFAEDLYKRLITYADDYGRFNADCQILLARLYPREIQIVTEDDIEEAMIDLNGVGKVQFYTSTARKELYGCLPKWKDHQRVRESKIKNPEPDDTSINDYYLRRFVPIELKKRSIERDSFTCQECGKKILSASITSDRLIKMGAGLFHIDHLVPVCQGGRAMEENLRLLCQKCNLARKKRFTFDEILAISRDLPQVAANRGDLPQVAAYARARGIQSNPIQSKSESNPNDCTEPQADSVPVAARLPLNDGSDFFVFEEQVQEWSKLYPAVNVPQELNAMIGWLNANPSRRKTKNGIKRFINGWLAREQDSDLDWIGLD